jgi:hypothetical protein
MQNQLWSLVSTDRRGYWYIQNQNGGSVVATSGVQGDELTTPQRSYDRFEWQAWGFTPDKRA